MNSEPLLQGKHAGPSRSPSCGCAFFSFFFIFFMTKILLFDDPWRTKEQILGVISSGSLVKTRTTRKKAIVMNIVDDVFAEICPLNRGSEDSGRSTIPIEFLDDISSPTFDQSLFTSISSWPFWNQIKQTDWYNDELCLGPLFCSDGQHHCTGAAPTYFRDVLTHFQSEPYNMRFTYHGSHEEDKLFFMNYMRALTGRPISRLYLINLGGMHMFLMEQFGEEFRIYQSFTNSFDLRFWTDSTISVDAMCEPGVDISDELLSANLRPILIQFGIQEEKGSVLQAKENYGSLKSIPRNEILELFEALAFGFELEEIKRRDGIEALIPASETFRVDTKKWLGKSAISLYQMYRQPRVEFNIMVSFMDYIHPH